MMDIKEQALKLYPREDGATPGEDRNAAAREAYVLGYQAKGDPEPLEIFAQALYENSEPRVSDIEWADLSRDERDRWRTRAHELLTDDRGEMWINAMSTVAPTKEFLEGVGRDVVTALTRSRRPEPDKWGIAPHRRITLRVVSS